MISGREIGLKNYSITGDNMLEFVFNQYSSMNLGNISEGIQLHVTVIDV